MIQIKKLIIFVILLFICLSTSGCKNNKIKHLKNAISYQGRYCLNLEESSLDNFIFYSQNSNTSVNLERVEVELKLISNRKYNKLSPVNVVKINDFYYEITYFVKFSNSDYKEYLFEKGMSKRDVYYSIITLEGIDYLYRLTNLEFVDDKLLITINGSDYSYKLNGDYYYTKPLGEEYFGKLILEK